jgi:hypothetical protein
VEGTEPFRAYLAKYSNTVMITRWDFPLVRSVLLSLLSLSRYSTRISTTLDFQSTPSTFSYNLYSQSTTFEFQDAGTRGLYSHLTMKTIILLLAVVATTFAMRELTLSRLFFLPITLTLHLQHPTSSIEMLNNSNILS